MRFCIAKCLSVIVLSGCGGRAGLETVLVGGSGGAPGEQSSGGGGSQHRSTGGAGPQHGNTGGASSGGSEPTIDAGLVCSATCAGTCTAGRCVTAIVSSVFAGPLFVDRTNVYFATSDGISKQPIEGGTPTTLASYPAFNVHLRIDDTSVYYGSASGPFDSMGGFLPSAVMKVGKNGGTPVTLVTGDSISNFAVDAKYLYWTEQFLGSVSKVSLDGGQPMTIASGQDSPQSIAVDGTSVYWGNRGGLVMKAPLGGGPAMTLSTFRGDIPDDIVVDDQRLFITSDADSIYSLPLDGGAPVTLATGQYQIWQMTVDATALYWAVHAGGKGGGIMKIGKEGGRIETLASGRSSGVAVDATSVYQSNLDMATIDRITPK